MLMCLFVTMFRAIDDWMPRPDPNPNPARTWVQSRVDDAFVQIVSQCENVL